MQRQEIYGVFKFVQFGMVLSGIETSTEKGKKTKEIRATGVLLDGMMNNPSCADRRKSKYLPRYGPFL